MEGLTQPQHPDTVVEERGDKPGKEIRGGGSELDELGKERRDGRLLAE